MSRNTTEDPVGGGNSQPPARYPTVGPDPRAYFPITEAKESWWAVLVHALADVSETLGRWPPGFVIALVAVALLAHLGTHVLGLREALGAWTVATVVLVLALLMAVITMIALKHNENREKRTEKPSESRDA
jgi:hypothetical protein